MALKTAEQYINSLRGRQLDLYFMGEKIDEPVDHPVIFPSINSIAETYRVAHEPEHQALATTHSELIGQTVNRFTSLFTSTADLTAKVLLQRLLGRRTGSCFQRCVGMDAINAVYSVTVEIDRACGTEYHARFLEFLKHVQREDLVVQGAMTDVKGDRRKSPSEQEDPDLYVRVVDRDDKGIRIRGAKAHQTGTVNSHEMLVMPTLRLAEEDADYAVVCALPVDAPGVKLIYGRQPCDLRKLDGGGMDVGNPQYGGQETLTIFEDAFVPWDRVFLCGETEYTGELVERFATYHRQSYGGCKPGMADALIGAAAQAAEDVGVEKASHIKDKLAEMIHMSETIHACGLACSSQGTATSAGNWMPDVLLANVCKLNVTRFPYEIGRLAEELAGGLVATLPSEKDLRHPVLGPLIEKYLRGKPGVSAEDRMRTLSLIHAISMGVNAPSFRIESLHGAGSPMAQKITINRHADLESKKAAARRLAGRKDPK